MPYMIPRPLFFMVLLLPTPLCFFLVTEPWQTGLAQTAAQNGSAEPNAEKQDAGGDAQRETDRLSDLAQSFQFFLTEDGSKPDNELQLIAAPLLTFTNPVRGREQIGAIYLWTHQKRPAVIGSLWTFRGDDQNRRLSIELHSLTKQTFSSTFPNIQSPRRQLPNWLPPNEPIHWRELASLKRVDAGKSRMRSLLRRSAARIEVEILDPTTRKAETLRPLSQPIYEYQTDRVAMGAVFANVLATDPEALLLIEARRVDDGLKLHYALARMTGRELQAKIEDEEVWSTDRAPVWDGTQAYYFCPNVAEF